MVQINQKAQSWSIDVILGVIVFIGAFFVFYALLNENTKNTAGSLKEEASKVVKQVAAEDSLLRIVDNNEINETKLGQLKNLSYDELKSRLRVEGDFCIYIEDDKGYVVLINNSYKGIGSPDINISRTPCSQK